MIFDVEYKPINIEYLKIKMRYLGEVETGDNWSTGRIYARIDNKESAQDIRDLMDEIINKHNSDLIYLGDTPWHCKPGWYKDNIRIKNNIYLGCWPNRLIQLDPDNKNLFNVEIIYGRKKDIKDIDEKYKRGNLIWNI